MNLSYVVNTVSAQPRAAVGDFNGVSLAGNVPGIEVELSDPTGQHGSVTLFFRTPEEKVYAEAAFKAGATVTLGLPDPVE